jgi:hypothetical protein
MQSSLETFLILFLAPSGKILSKTDWLILKNFTLMRSRAFYHQKTAD